MFSCKYCNKEYKSYQSRSNHIRIYHTIINTPNSDNNTPELSKRLNGTNIFKLEFDKNPPNSAKITPNTPIKEVSLRKIICEYCNYEFTRVDSLKKHYSRCKSKKSPNNIFNENNELKTIIKQQNEKIDKQSEELTQIKSILNELINKNCKVHPKTLQKINKQLNGDHNTINENNGTINNTFIIALGHENLQETFSKKEKINVLKNRFNSLPFLVEYTHFNNKYPQFKNILITNTQNNLAYRYDSKKKQFIAVDKNELLEDIVDERMCDINSFYDELETDLDEKTKDILDKVKDKIDNDPDFRELQKKDIKLIIYNNRSKVSKADTSNIELEL